MLFFKINLVPVRKKHFQNLFSAFKSQDNMQIDYIYVIMLMFLQNPIRRCKKLGKNEHFFSRRAKSWFLKFWL